MSTLDPKDPEAKKGEAPASQALAVRPPTGMVVGNLVIQKLARRFKWSPEALIKNIERALPSVVEQRLFLAIGAENRMRPRSLRIILRAYMGLRELQIYDLEGSTVLFDEVVSYLEKVFEIIDKTSLQYQDVNLSMATAAELVIAYGDNTEDIIASVESSLPELADRLNASHRSYERQMSICLHFLVWNVLKYNREHGVPDPVDPVEYFHDPQRLCLYMINCCKGYGSWFDRPDIDFSLEQLNQFVSDMAPALFTSEIRDLLRGERKN